MYLLSVFSFVCILIPCTNSLSALLRSLLNIHLMNENDFPVNLNVLEILQPTNKSVI